VLQRAGLVLCEDDYLPRSLGEAFEQIRFLSLRCSDFPEAPIVANGSGGSASPDRAFDARIFLPPNSVK
jgi:hypothetical protein